MAKWSFRRDTAFRKQFFVPESFAHPAKMDAQLLIKIVLDYTKSGEVILDPMAGMGTTMLACGLSRNVLLIELEGKFCQMCRDNWEQVKMRPQLGYGMGWCQIIQGDARNLEGLLVDKVVTSPPYANEATGKHGGGIDWTKSDRPITKGRVSSVPSEYSNNPDNLGNLPYGNIDAVVTSPPFSAQKTGGEQGAGKYSELDLSQGIRRVKDDYSEIENPENIGNLKSQSYLEAMLAVYSQCHKVLKPQGLMILVTKNFIRNKQVIRLDEDTIKLCEQAGFEFVERHHRKLPSQSFWRILYYKKHPEVEQINHEDILILRKDG